MAAELTKSSRACDGCTLCCKLVAVEELHKPQLEWCKHCQIGVGCKIVGSPERPRTCGEYQCLWLRGIIPEEFRPDECKVVFDATEDGKRVQVHCDPKTPDRWRNGKLGEFIRGMVDSGIDVIIILGDSRKLLTSRRESAEQLEALKQLQEGKK